MTISDLARTAYTTRPDLGVVGRPSIIGMLIRGAIAGAAATWLMDVATTAVQKLEPPQHAERERAAWPNGQPSVVNLVDLIADRLRVRLDQTSRVAAAGVAHYALGAVPGAMYATLCDRVPAIGAGRGLVFGALLWAVNDSSSTRSSSSPDRRRPTQS